MIKKILLLSTVACVSAYASTSGSNPFEDKRNETRAQAKAQANAIVDILDRAEADVTAAKLHVTRAEGERDLARTDAADAEKRFLAADAQAKLLDPLLKTAEGEVLRLNAELATAKKTGVGDVAAKQLEVDSATKEVARLGSALSATEKDRDDFERDLKLAQAAIRTHTTDLSDAQRDLKSMTTERDKLKKEHGELTLQHAPVETIAKAWKADPTRMRRNSVLLNQSAQETAAVIQDAEKAGSALLKLPVKGATFIPEGDLTAEQAAHLKTETARDTWEKKHFADSAAWAKQELALKAAVKQAQDDLALATTSHSSTAGAATLALTKAQDDLRDATTAHKTAFDAKELERADWETKHGLLDAQLKKEGIAWATDKANLELKVKTAEDDLRDATTTHSSTAGAATLALTKAKDELRDALAAHKKEQAALEAKLLAAGEDAKKLGLELGAAKDALAKMQREHQAVQQKHAEDINGLEVQSRLSQDMATAQIEEMEKERTQLAEALGLHNAGGKEVTMQQLLAEITRLKSPPREEEIMYEEEAAPRYEPGSVEDKIFKTLQENEAPSYLYGALPKALAAKLRRIEAPLTNKKIEREMKATGMDIPARLYGGEGVEWSFVDALAQALNPLR